MKDKLISFIFNNFPYRTLLFLYPKYMKLRKGKIYKKVLQYIENDDNTEIKAIVNDFRKVGYLKFFYGDWTKKYEKSDYPIDLRKRNGSFYINHKLYNGKIKKLYMPLGKGPGNCKLYYQSLLLDQDINSPHRYLLEDNYNYIKSLHGTVLDLGAAEGNFTLEMEELSDRIYCFEPDENMKYALTKTISPFNSKVTIVSKYVGDEIDVKNNITSIDGYFENDIPKDISVIKMDIEGFEQAALRGMKRTLEANPQAVLLICAYHQPQAEAEIRDILESMGYTVTARKGYMFFHEFDNFIEPYYRRGVLEARK
ncbi:MAG: FkbM family methyltransferase [Eubacterium sp.]|nr:FkbM family methyltransferase [Eubacterium sp.]